MHRMERVGMMDFGGRWGKRGRMNWIAPWLK